MNKLSARGLVESERPLPTDFDKFLPWACTQLSVEASVVITRTVLSDYVSVVASERLKLKGKQKANKPPSSADSDSDNIISMAKSTSFIRTINHDTIINIETVYDYFNNLIHIKFFDNKPIPRIIMKIIGLFIKFHPTVTMISINSGLQMEAMYEISKFLPLSKITEICLDHTYLVEANYYVLLEHTGLKHLSISKCKITDVVLKTIANKLTYPSPGSKTLRALNLATNRITDAGVKYLADMLRTNRHLYYLNLADNMITDQGARYLLDTLCEFPLHPAELLAKRTRHMVYLKEKKDLIAKTVKELRAGDFDKRPPKRKSVKPFPSSVSSKKKEKDKDNLSADGSKSLPSVDAIYFERAEILVEGQLGPFYDPYSADDTFMREGTVFCYGNNTLSYLNLAYNNLTYFSIKKLNEVIMTQKCNARKPRGLINVVIEGNFLPEYCTEYQQIDDTLTAAFPVPNRRASVVTKRKSLARNDARSFSK